MCSKNDRKNEKKKTYSRAHTRHAEESFALYTAKNDRARCVKRDDAVNE